MLLKFTLSAFSAWFKEIAYAAIALILFWRLMGHYQKGKVSGIVVEIVIAGCIVFVIANSDLVLGTIKNISKMFFE